VFFKKKKEDPIYVAKVRIFATFDNTTDEDGCPERFVLKSKLVNNESTKELSPQYVLDLDSPVVWTKDVEYASYFFIHGYSMIHIHDKLNIILLSFNLDYSQISKEKFHVYGVITDITNIRQPSMYRTIDFINKANATTNFERSFIHDLLLSSHKHYNSDIIVDSHKPNGSFHVKVKCCESSFIALKEEFLGMAKESHKLFPNEHKTTNTRMNIVTNNSKKLCLVLEKVK
jgi:hypothetical protein